MKLNLSGMRRLDALRFAWIYLITVHGHDHSYAGFLSEETELYSSYVQVSMPTWKSGP